MNRFDIFPTDLSSVHVIQRKRLSDDRGFLERLFCSTELSSFGFAAPVRQINTTVTLKKGSVRGLHFQRPPSSEMKLVTCLKGRVFDVAVDVRKSSPDYLHWAAAELSEENGKALLIPEGFAHGFQTLEPNSQLLYLHTADYDPLAEGALNSMDPQIGIQWPLAVTEISSRDASHSLVADGFEGIES